VARGPYCAVRAVLALLPAARRGLANEEVLAPRDILLVVRFTRNWIHYGFITHTVLCVVIAAVEGLLGR
jgi:hypothetical protein